MSTHRVTAKAVTMAALLLGGGLALAPEARATLWPNGVTVNGLTSNGLAYNGLTLNGMTLNGVTVNGQWTQGTGLNGRELNGSHAQGRPTRDDAAALGALRVRAVHLPDGRTLLPGRR